MSDLFVLSYEHQIGSVTEIRPPERSLADDEEWAVGSMHVSPHPMWDNRELLTVVWERRIKKRDAF